MIKKTGALFIFLFVFVFVFLFNAYGQMWRLNININNEDRRDIMELAIWDITISLYLKEGNNLFINWVNENDRENYKNAVTAVSQIVYEGMAIPEISRDPDNVVFSHLFERWKIIDNLKNRINYIGLNSPGIIIPESFSYRLNHNFSMEIGYNNKFFPGLTELALWDYSYQIIAQRFNVNINREIPLFLGLNHEDDFVDYTIIYRLIYLIMNSDNLNLKEMKSNLSEDIRRRVIIFNHIYTN